LRLDELVRISNHQTQSSFVREKIFSPSVEQNIAILNDKVSLIFKTKDHKNY